MVSIALELFVLIVILWMLCLRYGPQFIEYILEEEEDVFWDAVEDAEWYHVPGEQGDHLPDIIQEPMDDELGTFFLQFEDALDDLAGQGQPIEEDLPDLIAMDMILIAWAISQNL